MSEMGEEMKRPECPCHMGGLGNCKDRSAECHSTCERYRTWKAEWEAWKAETNRNRGRVVADYINKRVADRRNNR